MLRLFKYESYIVSAHLENVSSNTDAEAILRSKLYIPKLNENI